MAPTLAQLLAAPGLGLRVIAGTGGRPAALRRPVTWAAVSELADPSPYLEGGELVLLTGVDPLLWADAAGYVDRLVRAEAAGVGFGVGVVHPTVPAGLVTAADAAGLPLLEVDRPTPFVAVGKALADLIAVQHGERTRRRLDGMRALTGQFGRGSDPQAALNRLAHLVDGWAALLDVRARVVLTAGRRSRPEVATRLAGQLRGRIGHTSAADADALGRVTVLPLGLRDRPHGYLAVGVGPGADLDHHLVAFAASLLTLDREHARGTRPLRRWARAAAVATRAGLPVPAPPPGVLAGPLAGTAPVRVLVLAAGIEAVLDGLEDEDVVAGLPLDDGGCLLIVAEPDVEEVLAAANDALGPAGGAGGGLSAPVDPAGPDGAQLRAALDQARSLAARSRSGVLRAGAAAPSLLDLLGPQVAAAFADAVLAPVAAQPDGAALEQTLRAYLAAHGGLAAASGTLGVHRHTLRARLRRVAGLLGRDLDDPATRAELWVALEASDPRAVRRGPGPV
jgi:purine catabolism regulator